MTYTVIIPKSVQKQLDSLSEIIRNRILEEVVQLAEDPRPPGVVKLQGYDCEYRIRIGDYRVRYEISDKDFVVILLHCKHRKDVYRS